MLGVDLPASTDGVRSAHRRELHAAREKDDVEREKDINAARDVLLAEDRLVPAVIQAVELAREQTRALTRVNLRAERRAQADALKRDLIQRYTSDLSLDPPLVGWVSSGPQI